jgi:hypothetical protein
MTTAFLATRMADVQAGNTVELMVGYNYARMTTAFLATRMTDVPVGAGTKVDPKIIV